MAIDLCVPSKVVRAARPGECAKVACERLMRDRLITAGLRPTRERLTLSCLLFGAGHRHVSAELLHAEATTNGARVSLATVYNTLHHLKAAGLLREVAVAATTAYYDTNTSNHSHFFHARSGVLADIAHEIHVDGVPTPPHGTQISHIDVVVHLVNE